MLYSEIQGMVHPQIAPNNQKCRTVDIIYRRKQGKDLYKAELTNLSGNGKPVNIVLAKENKSIFTQ